METIFTNGVCLYGKEALCSQYHVTEIKATLDKINAILEATVDSSCCILEASPNDQYVDIVANSDIGSLAEFHIGSYGIAEPFGGSVSYVTFASIVHSQHADAWDEVVNSHELGHAYTYAMLPPNINAMPESTPGSAQKRQTLAYYEFISYVFELAVKSYNVSPELPTPPDWVASGRDLEVATTVPAGFPEEFFGEEHNNAEILGHMFVQLAKDIGFKEAVKIVLQSVTQVPDQDIYIEWEEAKISMLEAAATDLLKNAVLEAFEAIGIGSGGSSGGSSGGGSSGGSSGGDDPLGCDPGINPALCLTMGQITGFFYGCTPVGTTNLLGSTDFLSWPPAPGAEYYEAQRTWAPLVNYTNTVVPNNYAYATIVGLTSLPWRVRACNENGCGDWSDDYIQIANPLCGW